MLESARKTNDQAKRTELYRKFQELFSDRVPALILYYPVYTYGVDARVRGVQLAPMLNPSDRFRSLAHWYLKTKRVSFNSDAGEPSPAPSPTMLLPKPTIVVQPPAPVTPVASPTSPPQCVGLAAIIKSPAMDSQVAGIIEVRGSAMRTNMAYWKLEYRAETSPEYSQLIRSETPITDSVLSLWATKTVPNGAYWLQLTIVDNTGNFGTPCQIRVTVAN